MAREYLYITLFFISSIFLVFSLLSVLSFINIDYIINQQIIKQAPLVNGSQPLTKWSHPAQDTSFKYTLYLFNVTNPKDVKNGHNPIVREMGPYEFKQNKTWNLYDWDANDTELNFDLIRTFYRDSDCKGNLDDVITILNVPIISVANLIKIKSDSHLTQEAIKLIIKPYLERHSMFTTQKVGDILFNSYRDEFTKTVGYLIDTVKKYIHLDGPTSIAKDGSFSLLGSKNNTSFGLWTIDTGKQNLKELGRLKRIDRVKTTLDCWTGNCRSIHGTDGFIHHPFITDEEILPVFEPELNRTVFINFEKDTQFKGIPTKRFILSHSTYYSPSANPYNKCFCPKDDNLNKYNGILQVSQCNNEVPMVFSQPHFYEADNYFRQEIHGFNPNKTMHESFADITQELGIVINGRKTIQLNLDTNAHSFFINDGNYPRRIFPVFWLADSGSAGPSSIADLKAQLYDKVAKIKNYLIIFSAIFIAAFIVPLIYMFVDSLCDGISIMMAERLLLILMITLMRTLMILRQTIRHSR